ncbi:MAG: hypothetical protein RLZZ501_1742 [Pseudomonadota bacterium]|jgi:phage baseplate assembly protein V
MTDAMVRGINKLLDPIRRQIRNSIARGILTLIDDAPALQRVQVRLMAYPQPDGTIKAELGNETEVLGHYGFTSVPLVGAEAAYVSVGGVRGHGLVVAIDDRRYRPTGLKGGESQLYDDLGQKIYISREGIVIEGAGLPVKITGTPSVTIDSPQVTLTGALAVGNGITVTGDVIADGISLKKHVHVSGGAGAKTSAPQ